MPSGEDASELITPLPGAILRVMRPFTSYQQAFNTDVTSAIEELSSAVGDARKEGKHTVLFRVKSSEGTKFVPLPLGNA